MRTPLDPLHPVAGVTMTPGCSSLAKRWLFLARATGQILNAADEMGSAGTLVQGVQSPCPPPPPTPPPSAFSLWLVPDGGVNGPQLDRHYRQTLQAEQGGRESRVKTTHTLLWGQMGPC